MKRILDEINNYVKEKDIPLFIFYIQNKEIKDNRYEEIKQFCKERDIFFKAVFWAKNEKFYGGGHLNNNGHNSVAEIIYNELSEHKVLDILDDGK